MIAIKTTPTEPTNEYTATNQPAGTITLPRFLSIIKK